MCGIAGVLNPREGIERSVLEDASSLMVHRGPDDEGYFFEGPIALAHRRLSIIDLAGGAQPMFNEDRSLVLVFNGEIYNFADLRAELESKGHLFSTSSDTEIILHAFEEWGKGCLERLHGMFAFGLYNRKDKSLFLARDRCGEKPLFYCHDGTRLFFASEIQVLLTILGDTPTSDLESVYLYLRLGYIPSPSSFYRQIKKLEAGCSIIFRDGDLEKWFYYRPGVSTTYENATQQELCEELDAALSQAVKKMLVSDVPLGAFLSGGLDSSLIVAMMAKTGASPKTFSICFDDSSFDESEYARLVSEHIGTQHINYSVKFDEFDSCLAIMGNFGEPFADSSGIPTFYLSRETRKEVKVALSGDGSDELFGGYRRYLAQGLAERYLSLPSLIRKGMVKRALSLFSDGDSYYADSLIKSARIFMERADSSDALTMGLMLNTVFSHDEVKALFPDIPDGRGLMMEHIGQVQREKIEALMQADRLLYLPDDILVKVDRMSMRNSLEVRAPYLDPEVLALSERIPVRMKIKGVNLKYLLKKVALKYLPSPIVHRRKHGFMVPMAAWIKKAGKEDLMKRMPSGINSVALNQLIKPHLSGRVDNSHKLFALIVLGLYSDRVVL